MNNNARRRLVVIGLELADGSIDGSMQVIETLKGFTMKPMGETLSRDIARASLSKAGSVIGAKNWDITLPLELIGGGLNTGVVQSPPMHPVLLACGMVVEAGKVLTVSSLSAVPDFKVSVENTTATNTMGTMIHHIAGVNAGEATLFISDVQNVPNVADALDMDGVTATVVTIEDALVYRPSSDRTEHRNVTLHAHFDGQRRIATRAVADLSFDWEAGKYCTANFTLKGNYASPTNIAVPAADYADRVPAIVESAGLTIDDYPTDIGTIEKLGFALGTDIVAVPDVNSADGRHSFRIADRKPTGSVDPETTDLADFNPFTAWESGAKATIFATLGTVPGERVSICLPATQFTSISDKERAGSDAYDLPFDITGEQDDEFFLFFH